MGQSWSMQFSAGQKIGSDLWISVSLASKKKKRKRNARLLRWSSTLRTFSPAFVRFSFFFSFLFFSFFLFRRKERSLQQKGKLCAEVAALTLRKKKALAMDCMYLLMCFSLSQVFLDHILAAETHGELSIYLPPPLSFFFAFATCIEKCTFKSNVGK